MPILYIGTIFTPQTINSTVEISALIRSTKTPSANLNASTATLLDIYPDIPALGSPFDTGNDTFGLNPQYKRCAAISEYFQY
jgi:acetylcholinesterase